MIASAVVRMYELYDVYDTTRLIKHNWAGWVQVTVGVGVWDCGYDITGYINWCSASNKL